MQSEEVLSIFYKERVVPKLHCPPLLSAASELAPPWSALLRLTVDIDLFLETNAFDGPKVPAL